MKNAVQKQAEGGKGRRQAGLLCDYSPLTIKPTLEFVDEGFHVRVGLQVKPLPQALFRLDNTVR